MEGEREDAARDVGISLTGSVTKETRVRSDVVQSLAKPIRKEMSHDAYVILHISKPLMKVTERKVKKGAARERGRM